MKLYYEHDDGSGSVRCLKEEVDSNIEMLKKLYGDTLMCVYHDEDFLKTNTMTLLYERQ